MIRRHGETQRQFVERELAEAGRISAFDCVYSLTYADGSRCSITRLAAIIKELRDDGMAIDTVGEHGRLATYALRSQPVSRPSEPEWKNGWRCSDCGAGPVSEPEQLLGDMGRAFCGSCGAQRFFRRAA